MTKITISAERRVGSARALPLWLTSARTTMPDRALLLRAFNGIEVNTTPSPTDQLPIWVPGALIEAARVAKAEHDFGDEIVVTLWGQNAMHDLRLTPDTEIVVFEIKLEDL